MATLTQANTYHTARGNTDWTALATANAAKANALLADAEQHIRGKYNLRSVLSANEQALLDDLVCRLAQLFIANPPEASTTASIKSEKKEGAGFKKEVEYNATSGDPYPYITTAIRPLLVASSTSGGVGFAKLLS